MLISNSFSESGNGFLLNLGVLGLMNIFKGVEFLRLKTASEKNIG